MTTMEDSGTPARTGLRVLIIEDDPAMAALLKRGLTAEGYTVETAGDGIDGLVIARESEPVIAVVDVMLPGMSGLELCHWLRGQVSDLKILLLTALDDVDDRVRGLDAGADDYLTKPFAFTELAARMRALLRRDTPRPTTTLRAGCLVLDVLGPALTIGGHPVHLSPKEMAFLRLLLEHLGEAVSRADILSELWGGVEHTHPNIVDQYASYLRKKFQSYDTGVSIATERGIGFRLVETP